MKHLLLLLTILSLTAQAQDTIKLIPHRSDHFLANENEDMLITLDTTGINDHFEVQFLHKVKDVTTLRIYINGTLYRKYQCRISKRSAYAFYYPVEIKYARVEYLNKTLIVTK